MGLPLEVLALVFALAGAGPAGVGQELVAGETVPAAATGLLLPGRGAVELGEGSTARLGDGAGRLTLEAGRARAVAETALLVTTPLGAVRVERSGAVVSVEGGAVEVCAEGPGVAVVREGRADLPVEPGRCLGLVAGEEAASSPLDPALPARLRRGAEAAAPPPVEAPDLVGDPFEGLAEIEAAREEETDRGARQESAACGCSESGGGGGSLDTGGSGPPTPDLEPPDPGLVRVRVGLPLRGARR